MKVNLITDNPYSTRQGYVNIYSEQIKNLDELVDDAEAEEILALGVIDRYPFEEVPQVLDTIVKKLRHGGVLIIDCIDFRALARAVVTNIANLENFNNLVYGLNRKSALDINYLDKYFKSKGLKVVLKRIEEVQGIVKVERP
jgi:hypothetical protein